jgi:thiamine kinase-like enzyme
MCACSLIVLQLEWMFSYLDSVGSPLVFCHNDLLSGNIIYNEGEDTLQYKYNKLLRFTSVKGGSLHG